MMSFRHPLRRPRQPGQFDYGRLSRSARSPTSLKQDRPWSTQHRSVKKRAVPSCFLDPLRKEICFVDHTRLASYRRFATRNAAVLPVLDNRATLEGILLVSTKHFEPEKVATLSTLYRISNTSWRQTFKRNDPAHIAFARASCRAPVNPIDPISWACVASVFLSQSACSLPRLRARRQKKLPQTLEPPLPPRLLRVPHQAPTNLCQPHLRASAQVHVKAQRSREASPQTLCSSPMKTTNLCGGSRSLFRPMPRSRRSKCPAHPRPYLL